MPDDDRREPAPIETRGYVRPELLVSTEWVAERLDDPEVAILESDEDLLLYETGHVPGASKIDWVEDLNHPIRRDYVDREALQSLLRARGIDDGSTIVVYGDRNNWWAAYTLWVFHLFGLERVRLMDGGRARWIDEGRELSTEVPDPAEGGITVPERDDGPVRVFRAGVQAQVDRGGQLVDVRSPEEFRGERLHMPDYPNEGALRGGHIPGARNVPWSRAVDPDTHTFLDADGLRAIYVEEEGLDPDEPVVTYCRIGERSSHTWFVLRHLLGFEDVKNYDGSWTEWGNLVGAPIER